MLSAQHEDASHGTVRKNVMGRSESFGRRDHKLFADGTGLAIGAHQEGTAERVDYGQLHRGHHRFRFHKTR